MQRSALTGIAPVLLLGFACALGLAPRAPAAAPPDVDLMDLSLEELGKVRVTSVSRKSEVLSGAAAAIHVINQDDIRRSGATILAEALRMAPGLQVARANSRQWGITARGFNETFSNKLLVLFDGRSLYTPLFSGVFWEETDTVLEDIDRIEVIRGPGASLWGANAVNGVINIITKSAKETQGTLITGGGGFEERGFGAVRYGGQLMTNAHYRVYAKYGDHDEFTRLDGRGAGDDWWLAQGGFRTDWQASEPAHFTFQGDIYRGVFGGRVEQQVFDPPAFRSRRVRSQATGANLLGRWSHRFSSDSDMSIQVYFDHTDRDVGVAQETRDTLDLDGQHRFHLGDRHEVVWGAGYRYSADDITETPDLQMADPSVGLQLFSGFLQDQIELVPDRLSLTVGSKLEHHDFTGFEIQPSARAAWTPDGRQTIWAAVSRAVRTPSRTDRDIRAFADIKRYLPPLPLAVVSPGMGSPGFASEEVIAYELGYRWQPHTRVSFDLAAFYNHYDDLRSISALQPRLLNTPGPNPATYLFLPITLGNNLRGDTYGLELSALWQPIDRWRLRASYTVLETSIKPVRPDPTFAVDSGGNNPNQTAALWSQADLGRKVEWGLGIRYVDELEALLLQIPAYTELETRLAWNPTPHCELAIICSNLLHAHHQEFNPVVIYSRDIQVDRAVYFKATLRF